MESKIEKLKGKYYIYPKNSKDEVVEYLNALCKKQNEIIDHLNSQAQPEEKEVNEMYDFNERTITTYIVDEDKVITILRQEEMPEWLKKGDVRVLKDTPEEWEGRLTTGSLGESEYFRIDGEYVDDKETMVRFIKQLLDEREREVRKSVLKEVREWLFSYLDKLNK